MNLLQIVDRGDGQADVVLRRSNALSIRCPRPVSYTDPLSARDREELRWYLEQYLQFPYGAERWHATQVEQKMTAWGEALFHQVFPMLDVDPNPRALYEEAIRDGPDQCQLCIRSEDSAVLNIPWELIRDPAPGRGYLAPLLGGLFRQRPGPKRRDTRLPPRRAGPYRILLVICRPEGARYVPLGTVARPVLQALRALRPRVHLEVLRPPTFDALQAVLNARRGSFDLVHFDGHGMFAHPTGASTPFGIGANRGHLIFETAAGQEDIVDSEELGKALAKCGVPLFVLNACKSAHEGTADPFGSVAAQLVAVGAEGVVAMAYSVYASSAASFMQRFYERLVAHASLAEATAAGRQLLCEAPLRASVAGPLELQDWLVPTLYQQEHEWIPIPVGADLAGEHRANQIEQGSRAEVVCPEGEFGFIGRDYDLLRIERALQRDNQPWIVLTGVGGTGKTELARGFARWYAETGGCPAGIFATSFKEKADLGQVLGSIVGYGTDFSRLPERQQWDKLIAYLRSNPCLLVWDNVEPVAGYPEGAPSLATVEQRAQLARFLKALKRGKSRVLITTRKTRESWLGVDYQRVELRGLAVRDAIQLAEAILRKIERRPEDFRDDPAYAELLNLLRGHPRSLVVVLPRLQTHSPREIIHALQDRVDRLGESLEDASLTFAFDLLSEQTRRHLPFLGLFATNVNLAIVSLFVASRGQHQEVYASIVGEAADENQWLAVLEDAARNGLLRSLGNGLFQLHPTLPPFFRRQLQARVGEGGLAQLEQEFVRFYAHLGDWFHERVRGGDKGVLTGASIEEGNFLRAVRRGVQDTAWTEVCLLGYMLAALYRASRRDAEWWAVRRELLDGVGQELPVSPVRDQVAVWLFLVAEEANDALNSGDLTAAEQKYQRMLSYLERDADTTDVRIMNHVALAYHQLGRVAKELGQPAAAEDWFRRALVTNERQLTDERQEQVPINRRELERSMALSYRELGILAARGNQLDEAEQLYRKAVAIHERIGPQRDMANGYHQLGIIALTKQHLTDAEQWFGKALAISESLGLHWEAGTDYHGLGAVAERRGRLEEAEQWYRKALANFERLGLRRAPELERAAANAYGGLGSVAAKRHRIDHAEQWYRSALEIHGRLGPTTDAAYDFHKLGELAERRLAPKEAVPLYEHAEALLAAQGHSADLARVQRALARARANSQ